MNPVTLHINTDRNDRFSDIADFVDAVRRISNVPDDQVDMTFNHAGSDHEVALHEVDPHGDWNRKAIEVDNGTVVVFRKEALAPEDGEAAWRLAYEEREITLTTRGNNTSRVLRNGQVMIKGVGDFPKSHFRVVQELD